MITVLKPSRLRAALAEPALQRTGGYYLLFICLGLGSGVTGPTLPALAAQTHTRLGDLGLVFLAGAAGFTLGTAIAGRVIDRLPGRAVLGVAQIVSAGLIFVVPLTPNLLLLLAVLAGKGMADGFISVGANTFLVWTHRERVGPYMNGLHFCFGLGAFVSPLVVAQVIAVPDGYRWAYWIVAAVGLLACLRIITLGESRRPEPQPGSPMDARRVDVAIVISAALLLFFYVGAEVAFGGWVYTYALELKLASAAGAAYLTSAFWLAFTVGRLFSIPLATRLTATKTILIAMGGCLLLLAAAIALPSASAVVWALAVGLGFCMAPIWPTSYTLAGQSVAFTARTSGLILLGDSFGGMVLPAVSGQVIDWAGPQAMVYLVLGSLLCCLAAFGAMLYWRRARPRRPAF